VTDHEVGEARITSSFRVLDFSGKTRKEIGVNAAHRNNADPTIITIPLTPTELTSTGPISTPNGPAAPVTLPHVVAVAMIDRPPTTPSSSPPPTA
jgi:hypothetical protein